MVLKMRDRLGKKEPLPAADLVMNAKGYIVAIRGRPGVLQLNIVPLHMPDYRRYRAFNIQFDRADVVELLVTLLDLQEVLVNPERELSYEGPVKGRATRMRVIDATSPGEVPVDVIVSAGAPKGYTAKSGDIFVSFSPASNPGLGQVSFRLDMGAKRFLISQLEQSIVIDAHLPALRKSFGQLVLARAREWLGG